MCHQPIAFIFFWLLSVLKQFLLLFFVIGSRWSVAGLSWASFEVFRFPLSVGSSPLQTSLPISPSSALPSVSSSASPRLFPYPHHADDAMPSWRAVWGGRCTWSFSEWRPPYPSQWSSLSGRHIWQGRRSPGEGLGRLFVEQKTEPSKHERCY